MMADTSTSNGGVAAGSPSVVGGGSGGALDPNVIPQWKKELIQRRKNLAKTIGAVATQVHDSASTVAAAISASASSPVLAHPRTPTGGFPVGSPFYAGTKENQPTNTSTPLDGTVPDSETEHDSHGTAVPAIDSSNDSLPPSVNAHTAAAAAAAVTSPTTAPGSFMGVHFAANEHLQQQHHQHQQQARGVGSSSVGVLRASEAVAVVVQPSSSASGSSPTSVPTANGAHSHSNAGSEHSGSSAAIATNRTGSSGTNSSVIVERESSSTVCSSGGPGTHTTSGIGSGSSSSSSSSSSGTSVKSLVSGANGSAQQQQQHGNAREGGVAARKMVAATAAEEIVVVYEKSSVLGGLADATGGGGGGIGGGGVGAGGITALGDAGEELKYGPGIVSRLRCRYLSLALRQSVAKQRPSLNSMRRATSLNNLLDEESEDLSEREQSIGSEGTGHGGGPQQQQQQQQKKYQSQNYHYQHHQQQQQQHREQYANGNGNNHNHNHQQQQQLHPTVVLQPPYQKQPQHHFAPKQQPWIQQQLHKEEDGGGGAVKTAPFLRGVQNSYTRASRQVEKKNEYNRYTKHHRGAGGADAVLLKRARSVEALVRYDHKAWERDGVSPVVAPAAAVTTTAAAAAAAVAAAPTPAALAVSPTAEVGSNVIILDEIAQAPTTAQATVLPAGGGSEGHATTNGISSSVSPTATMLMNGGKGGGAAGGGAAATPTELPLLVSDCVTIEEKIINGREKGDPKPKRLTSIIDADERPPPDVVKQTMKIFEANANRRGGRGVNGSTNGGSDVATKVASYRSIIISGSATAGATTAAAAVGPGEKPPITHPKPPLSPKKPNIMPRTASPKQQQQQPHQVTAAKPPPTPKSLEAVNNLKNAPATAAAAPPIVAVKNNNKAPIGGGGGGATSESTPPSPPARSKHTAAAAAAAAAALNGVGVGVAVSKNMQSDDDGTQSADPTADAKTADAKTTNALKNGVGTVRDHHQHHDSSSNGTTQTAAAVTPSAKQSAPGSDGGNGGSGHQHKHNGNTALEAAAVPSAASSPTTGICDSPSIQQLTTKLGSLHLATSTPTGAANGSAVSVQDRRNLEYVTSDEEEEDDDDDEDVEEGEGDNVDGENERGRRNNSSRSYQVNPESSESEDARDGAASGGSENDADDDEEAELDDDEDERSVRKISRTAMENIARAGTTTQFRFNGAVKSYLPGGAMGKPAAPAPSTKAPAPPIPMSRESLAGKANGASTAAAAVQAIEVSGRLPPEGAPNNSVNGVGGGGSAKQHSSGSTGALLQQGGGGYVGSSTAPSPPSLTRREIEKNQINREKSGEPAVPAAAASSGTNSINGSVASSGGVQVASANNNNNNANNANPSGASGGGGGGAKQTSAVDSTTSFVAKWGTGGMVGSGVAAVATAGQSSPLAGLVPVRKKTKPPPSHQQEGTNTMVFNFSDRKDVPDYIENDGVIIRPRPRELPKPGESGFVVLGDLTLETSTDPDDAWAAGPPSPCNGEFANAYIVINGKSSMRNKTSRSNNKFKIQFDDSLTSTYEYPSETSLLEETNGFDGVDNGTDTNGASAFADNGLLSHTNKLLSSVPLGSAPFASYTPVKAAIDTTFELGVTRTPSPSAASTASSTGSNGSLTSASNHSSNSHHSATSASSSGSSEKKQHLPHTVPNGHHHPVDRSNSNGLHSSNGHSGSPDGGATLLLNGGTGPADGDALFNGATGEPESIQYLKPASDEQTVNWSQGTRVTDLLF